MKLITEACIQEQFDLSELSATFLAVVRQSIQDPVYWYIFLNRYTHFNSCASGAAYRLASSIALSRYLFQVPGSLVLEESDQGIDLANQLITEVLRQELSHHSSRRTLVQAILKSAGDYAGLLPEERNFFASPPLWLRDVVTQFISDYEGYPGQIVSLVRAMGFHAASEILDHLEYCHLSQVNQLEKPNDTFHQCLMGHLPLSFLKNQPRSAWCQLLRRHAWQPQAHPQTTTALDMLNWMVDHRPEPTAQILDWALTGVDDFIQIQGTLLRGIYRECLEIAHICQEPVDVL
jgi:hypothetical protein